MAGQIPEEKHKKQLFRAANVIFRMLYSGILQEPFPVKELIKLSESVKKADLENTHFIAITERKAFICREGTLFPQTGHMGAMGTGGKSIMACYFVVQDLCTAFKLSSELDPLSSMFFTTVRADTLSPFIME